MPPSPPSAGASPLRGRSGPNCCHRVGTPSAGSLPNPRAAAGTDQVPRNRELHRGDDGEPLLRQCPRHAGSGRLLAPRSRRPAGRGLTGRPREPGPGLPACPVNARPTGGPELEPGPPLAGRRQPGLRRGVDRGGARLLHTVRICPSPGTWPGRSPSPTGGSRRCSARPTRTVGSCSPVPRSDRSRDQLNLPPSQRDDLRPVQPTRHHLEGLLLEPAVDRRLAPAARSAGHRRQPHRHRALPRRRRGRQLPSSPSSSRTTTTRRRRIPRTSSSVTSSSPASWMP